MTGPRRTLPRAVDRALRVLALLATGSFVVAAYLPGSTNPDTIDMCAQAIQRRFTDWHSPALTALWSSSRLPVAAVFVLTVAVTLVAVWAILDRWLRPWAAVAGTAVVMWFPATLGWMGHVGKDMWFAAGFFAAVALMGRAELTTRTNLRRSLLIAAVLCCWLAVAARKNAALPIGAALLVAWPAPLPPIGRLAGFPRLRRVLAAASVLVLVVVSVSAFTSLVVRPQQLSAEQSTFLFDLTGISLAEGELLVPDGTFPPGTTLEQVDAYFDVKAGDGFFFAAGTPVDPVLPAPQVERLRDEWVQQVLAHPDDYVRLRLAYTWALLGVSAPHPFPTVNDPTSDPADFGLECQVPDRAFPALHQRLFDTLQRIESWNLFRGWVFLVTLVVAAAVAGLRTVVEARALLVGGVLTLAGLAVAGISPTFRYSWFTALCAVLAVCLAARRIPWLGRPSCEATGRAELPSPPEEGLPPA